jgi:UDP-glucuronate decarboxylase
VKQKSILVTGGAGFLGSHLVDRLLEQGHFVHVLDNLVTGTRTNLAHHKANQKLNFIKQDVCSPIDVSVDEIFNMACPASPIHYQADRIATLKTSVLGALSVLELARHNGARILQASTSEVYGDPLVHPQPESYWGNVNPNGLRSCYDEGKRAAETLFFDYQRQYNLDIRVARIFNTYGPRMHPKDGRVVSNFIVQALNGQDLTVFGDGTQTRSFCYVDDLIDGLMKLMAVQGPVTSPVNLGNDGEFTMIELADMVAKQTGMPVKPTFSALPNDDPQQRKPDLTKAKALLDWKPMVNLETGLEKTIAYFSARKTSEPSR